MVGSLLLLAVLAVAALFLVPTEKVANLAAGEFRKITGRELYFDGSVRPTLWPHLGARTGRVTLANADWSGEGPMLTADALSIAVDIPALLGGAVRVTGIELTAPRLVLERAEDGRVELAVPRRACMPSMPNPAQTTRREAPHRPCPSTARWSRAAR